MRTSACAAVLMLMRKFLIMRQQPCAPPCAAAAPHTMAPRRWCTLTAQVLMWVSGAGFVAPTAAATAAAATTPTCPPHLTLMATVRNYSFSTAVAPTALLLVCEDLRFGSNGSFTFISQPGSGGNSSTPWPLTLRKRVYPNTVANDSSYLDGRFTKAQVLSAPVDVMGNLLLGLHGNPPRAAEPTLADVWGAIPPIRRINGARVWTANRFSAVDATFDESGANNGAGTPCPAEVGAVLPSLASGGFTAEGVVDELPVLLLHFPLASAGELPADRCVQVDGKCPPPCKPGTKPCAGSPRSCCEPTPPPLGVPPPPPSAGPALCHAGYDCCYGLDLPRRGDDTTAADAASCAALCNRTKSCAAFVFKVHEQKCWLKSALRAAEGHPSTWSSWGSCVGLRSGGGE